MDQLDVGEPLLVSTRWWDDAGDAVEPSTIALTVTKPDGSTITKTKADMTQGASVADWWYETTADQAGLWRIHAEAVAGGDTRILDSMVLVAVGEDSGPCEDWCTWEDVTACGSITGDTSNALAQQLWIAQATEILWNLTERRYPGLCTVTRSLCFACRTCYPVACSCDPYPSIDLGGRFPVWGIVEVVLDGEVQPATEYVLRDRRYLVRTNGQWWPSGWNSADAARFRATWVTGRKVRTGGRLAAARLANEIAKRCTGDSSCKLPSRVQSVQREGMQFVVLDPMTMIQEGRTGLDMVDMWLASDKIGRAPKPGAFHPALHGNRRLA